MRNTFECKQFFKASLLFLSFLITKIPGLGQPMNLLFLLPVLILC